MIGAVLELKALERKKSHKIVQFPPLDFGSVEYLTPDSPLMLRKSIYRVPGTRHLWKYIPFDLKGDNIGNLFDEEHRQ